MAPSDQASEKQSWTPRTASIRTSLLRSRKFHVALRPRTTPGGAFQSPCYFIIITPRIFKAFSKPCVMCFTYLIS